MVDWFSLGLEAKGVGISRGPKVGTSRNCCMEIGVPMGDEKKSVLKKCDIN